MSTLVVVPWKLKKADNGGSAGGDYPGTKIFVSNKRKQTSMNSSGRLQSWLAIWVSLALLSGSEMLFAAEGDRRPTTEDAAGLITLSASNAVTHGTQIRYEPAPVKNCLGYWTQVEDWAEWEFSLKQPGMFDIEVWQGCGQGQGGSEVELEVEGERFTFVVEETGHFQIFLPRRIGKVSLAKTGKCTLTLRARHKQGAAIMDVSQVLLVPIGESAALKRSFPGKRSLWLGFERFDFEVDGRPVLGAGRSSNGEDRRGVGVVDPMDEGATSEREAGG